MGEPGGPCEVVYLCELNSSDSELPTVDPRKGRNWRHVLFRRRDTYGFLFGVLIGDCDVEIHVRPKHTRPAIAGLVDDPGFDFAEAERRVERFAGGSLRLFLRERPPIVTLGLYDATSRRTEGLRVAHVADIVERPRFFHASGKKRAKCRVCQGRVTEGEGVLWIKGMGLVHSDCRRGPWQHWDSPVQPERVARWARMTPREAIDLRNRTN